MKDVLKQLIMRRDVKDLPFREERLPLVDGEFRQSVTTFFVEELPLYLPEGEGDHLFVEIMKQDLNTQEMLQLFQDHFKLRREDVGYAGLKDRKATTRQWVSLRGIKPFQLEGVEIPGVEVLQAKQHHHKLRIGHLKGNRFRLSVESAQREKLKPWLAVLAQHGFPNYFGPQRFGTRGSNVPQGRALLLEQKKSGSRWKRKFWMSCYQSALFNDLLAHRVEQGLLDTVMEGDILKKHDSGGSFRCEEVALDQPRADRLELSPTAFLPGYKVDMARGLAGQWEEAILEREGLSCESFRVMGKIAQGTRRSLRIPVNDAQVEREGDRCWFGFSLPPGAYASVMLRMLGIQWARESG